MKVLINLLFATLLVGLSGCKNDCFTVSGRNMLPNFPVDSEVCFSPKDTIENGDVVLFDYDKELPNWMSRVVAASGDHIGITNGYIVINGDTLQEDYDIINEFTIEAASDIPQEVFQNPNFDSINGESLEFKGRKSELVGLMEGYKLNGTIKASSVDTSGLIEAFETKELVNASNIPQIYIPKPREVVQIDLDNITLYQMVLDTKQKKLIQGGGTVTYTVTESLYFLLGDNRPISRDSRYIGFVPKNKIKGVYLN